jgi:hypothetical protein
MLSSIIRRMEEGLGRWGYSIRRIGPTLNPEVCSGAYCAFGCSAIIAGEGGKHTACVNGAFQMILVCLRLRLQIPRFRSSGPR